MVRVSRFHNNDSLWTTTYKIHLSSNNESVTNIDLPQDWSYFPLEEEVLLMPGFCFIVVGSTKDKEKKVTEIELVEIPHQNLLQMR